jgi:hypothetical protein
MVGWLAKGGRVLPQRIAVVGVLVSGDDLKHPLPQHLFQTVPDISLMAGIPNDLGHPAKKTQTTFGLSNQKQARIRSDFAALEVRLRCFASQVFKK